MFIDWIGKRIGPWRIEALIGVGGRSEIYRAERLEGGYQQTVAIKIAREGIAARESDNERMCLDALKGSSLFPRLLDGGLLAPSGRGYLVMEFIDGQPLDQYADEQGLDVAGRLKLFIPVCRAMEQMIQQGILHLDLKPANILVARDGHVKVIDFGQSRKQLPGSKETATIGDAITLEYASPEQIGRGSFSAATDVYSAGCVLFRILTGRTPLEISRTEPDSRAEVIAFQCPPRPSDAAMQASIENPNVAKFRRTTPTVLQSQLRKGVDTLLEVCLRKDSGARYQSGGDLLANLEKVLAGRKPSTRPSNLGYQAVRFSQSKPAWFSAAGLVLVSFYAEYSVYGSAVLFPNRAVVARETFLAPVTRAAGRWQLLRDAMSSSPKMEKTAREMDEILEQTRNAQKEWTVK